MASSHAGKCSKKRRNKGAKPSYDYKPGGLFFACFLLAFSMGEETPAELLSDERVANPVGGSQVLSLTGQKTKVGIALAWLRFCIEHYRTSA